MNHLQEYFYHILHIIYYSKILGILIFLHLTPQRCNSFSYILPHNWKWFGRTVWLHPITEQYKRQLMFTLHRNTNVKNSSIAFKPPTMSASAASAEPVSRKVVAARLECFVHAISTWQGLTSPEMAQIVRYYHVWLGGVRKSGSPLGWPNLDLPTVKSTFRPLMPDTR